MKKFDIGDRVEHEYLGNGEIIKVIKSMLNSRENAAYIVMFDEQPAMAYNMGENPCLVFPSSLNKID